MLSWTSFSLETNIRPPEKYTQILLRYYLEKKFKPKP